MMNPNERCCMSICEILQEAVQEAVKDLQDLMTGKRKSRAPDIKNREELECLLAQNGIYRNSKDWKDYSKAKGLFTGGFEWIDQDKYHELIAYTFDYLGL